MPRNTSSSRIRPTLLVSGAASAGNETMNVVPVSPLPNRAACQRRSKLVPLGIPPLKELIQFALDNKVPVHT